MTHSTRKPALRSSLALVGVLLSFPAPVRAADHKVECVNASEQAQVLRDQGKLKEALAQLLVCARSVCPGVVQHDCDEWLSGVEASLPSVTLSATGPNGQDASSVRVLIDGVESLQSLDGKAIRIDPGAHTLRFEMVGATALEQRVVIGEGEKNRAIHVEFEASAATPTPTSATASPEPAAARAGAPTAAWVIGGAGMLALGGFAALAASGSSKLSALKSSCGETHDCSDADLRTVKTRYALADASLGVGLVAIGVAAVWILSSSRRHEGPPQAAARVTVSPTRSGIGGELRVAF